MTATAAEPVEATWPSATFLKDAQRLRSELEKAIRLEKDLAQRVASIQDQSFQKALPAAMLAGGPDALRKLYALRDAAGLSVNDRRAELRQFLAASRAEFFASRERAQEHLHAVIAEQFARAQKNAAELLAIFGGFLGAGAEAEREEKSIRAWNRVILKFNRVIPSANIDAIPAAVAIAAEESIRSRALGMLLQDKGIRTLCREFFAHEAQQRERATAFEEAKIDERERTASPVSMVEPF